MPGITVRAGRYGQAGPRPSFTNEVIHDHDQLKPDTSA